jgi:hypothetical protein
MMGGRFLPGSVARRAALNATVSVVIHAGLAPEPHYPPSKALVSHANSTEPKPQRTGLDATPSNSCCLQS